MFAEKQQQGCGCRLESCCVRRARRPIQGEGMQRQRSRPEAGARPDGPEHAPRPPHGQANVNEPFRLGAKSKKKKLKIKKKKKARKRDQPTPG